VGQERWLYSDRRAVDLRIPTSGRKNYLKGRNERVRKKQFFRTASKGWGKAVGGKIQAKRRRQKKKEN